MRVHAFGHEAPETLLPVELVARAALEMIASESTGLVIDVRREQRGSDLRGGLNENAFADDVTS